MIFLFLYHLTLSYYLFGSPFEDLEPRFAKKKFFDTLELNLCLRGSHTNFSNMHLFFFSLNWEEKIILTSLDIFFPFLPCFLVYPRRDFFFFNNYVTIPLLFLSLIFMSFKWSLNFDTYGKKTKIYPFLTQILKLKMLNYIFFLSHCT